MKIKGKLYVRSESFVEVEKIRWHWFRPATVTLVFYDQGEEERRLTLGEGEEASIVHDILEDLE